MCDLYLEGSQSYYWGCGSAGGNCSADPLSPGHDMWHDLKPGTDVVSEIFYSANFYTSVATSIIKNHAANYSAEDGGASSTPLFLYLPYQNVHSPDQSPAPWETHSYPSWSPGRGEEKTMQIYANMLDMLDSGLGNVSAALSSAGMWTNTLLVLLRIMMTHTHTHTHTHTRARARAHTHTHRQHRVHR